MHINALIIPTHTHKQKNKKTMKHTMDARLSSSSVIVNLETDYI